MTALLTHARDYQRDINSELLALLDAGATHAYLQSPTGTGKSFMIALFNESLPARLQDHHRFIMVGRGQIRNQLESDFIGSDDAEAEEEKLAFADYVDDISLYSFWTWQGLYARCRAYQRAANKPGGYTERDKEALSFVAQHRGRCVLSLDEAHLGSSNDDAKSVRTILEVLQPAFRLYVSATCWDLNEKVLGPKEGRIVTFSMEDAYRVGALAPVWFHRYEMGTELSVIAVETINAALKKANKSIDDIIAGDSVEEVVEECNERKVDIKGAAQKIAEHRMRSLVELYRAGHSGAAGDAHEQALFYAPSVEWAEKTAEMLGEDAEAIHSRMSPGVADTLIERFKAGGLRIAVVCGMLKEGFDHPALRLVFDGSFNANNTRVVVQKVGRIMRPFEGKEAIYYYAVDPKLYVPSARVKDVAESFMAGDSVGPASDGRVLTGEEREMARRAAADTLNVAFAVNGVGDGSSAEDRSEITVPWMEPEIIEVGSERVVRTAFYRVEEVGGVVAKGRVSWSEVFMFGIDVDFHRQEIIDLATGGADRPQPGTKIYHRFNYYMLDAEFAGVIKKVAPHWLDGVAVKDMDGKKKELIYLAERGSDRPLRGSTLYNAFRRFTNVAHRSYDHALYVKLNSLSPKWFINPNQLGKIEKQDSLTEMAISGQERPSQRGKLGAMLSKYTSNNDVMYDPDFDAKIRAIAPHWFRKKK